MRLRHGSSPCYVESLYDDPARGRDADRSTSAGGSDGDGGSGNRNGNRKTASLSVTGMEQKLAELLLLSNTPDMDSGRIMAAAGLVQWAFSGVSMWRMYFVFASTVDFFLSFFLS